MQHDSPGSSGSSPLQNFVGNLVYVTETPIPMQKVTKNSTIDVICIQGKPLVKNMTQYDDVPVIYFSKSSKLNLSGKTQF